MQRLPLRHQIHLAMAIQSHLHIVATSQNLHVENSPYQIHIIIVKNESQIKAILEKSKYSLTAPIERQPRQEQPYAKRSNTVLDTKREIECLFQENRYEIRLDINAFFDNI